MKKGIAFAILAAALYAVNAPFSKILLDCIPPTLMAGFLYVGAGIGMIIIALVRKIRKTETNELKLTKSELPYLSLIHISEPTRRTPISYAVFCLKKKKKKKNQP